MGINSFNGDDRVNALRENKEVKKLVEKFVYILRLERGKYYVGLTTSPVRRCRQHFSGLGAAWTRKHGPLEILLVKPGNKEFQTPQMREETYLQCNQEKTP